MKYFEENGFINYFGTQRFGTTGVPTHHIGKEIIASNFTEAINLILKPRESESNVGLKEARSLWASSKDAQKALDVLRKARKDRTVEGKLLFGLAKCHRNDQVLSSSDTSSILSYKLNRVCCILGWCTG